LVIIIHVFTVTRSKVAWVGEMQLNCFVGRFTEVDTANPCSNPLEERYFGNVAQELLYGEKQVSWVVRSRSDILVLR